MSKKLVLKILEECVEQQSSAIFGGIVGGKEAEKFADQDYNRYCKALRWAEKNLK